MILNQGSVSSNLSTQRKVQICQITAAPQVSQLFSTDDLTVLFALLGSAGIKAACKHVGEIDPCLLRFFKIISFKLLT